MDNSFVRTYDYHLLAVTSRRIPIPAPTVPDVIECRYQYHAGTYAHNGADNVPLLAAQELLAQLEPWSGSALYYSVSVAQSVREKGAKRPHRRIVVYLGSVSSERQRIGIDSINGEWSACRMRCLFWIKAQRRLTAAVTHGRLTEEERAQIVAELAEAIPQPSADHFDADGAHYSYHTWRGCALAPIHLPDHVEAATKRAPYGS